MGLRISGRMKENREKSRLPEKLVMKTEIMVSGNKENELILPRSLIQPDI